MGGRGASYGGSSGNVLQTAYPNATKNVVAFEDSVRTDTIETMVFFDKNGNRIFEKKGDENEVSFTQKQAQMMSNNIVTHNHPLHDKKYYRAENYRKLGVSFSGTDIKTAISFNAAEIRAVTEKYTFSMKRPKTGWGVSGGSFIKEYNKEHKKVWSGVSKRIKSGTLDRLLATADHTIMKTLSKKYGWDYSKKKNK